MAKKIEESVLDEPVFTREQILESKKYKHLTDWLGAILLPGKSYTLKQVDDALKKELGREHKSC